MFGRRMTAAFVLLLTLAVAAPAQDKTTGAIKGKVTVDNSSTPENVTVIVRRDGEEVRRAETNRSGEFRINGLAPGLYGITFRKPGLSIGTLEKVEVRAGKTKSLTGRGLFLPVDTGALAFIRGSVFNADGRVVPGARVELALVREDGTQRKLDGRVTTESGMFQFRLTPERARYVITVRAEGMASASKEVDVEGAGRTNIAITVRPATP
ncbi:MAG TPA: carboxypeptidase-like regulatory domain-containing protein [Pyrinomonadaceae bacterium]|nr:carboxypeptidase-like regulatory domain-containing protein [Pyrinomonadaceae bacterium]